MKRQTSQLLREAEDRCRQSGRQWTAQRADVLAVMADQTGPVTAYELLDAIKSVHPNPKPATVYRALEFFMELGLVHKLDSANRFVLCSHQHQHHTAQFLICDGCGHVDEIPVPAKLLDVLEEQSARLDFEMADKGLEIHGHCSNCRHQH
ncbi:Fur family transcriptional regulator [Gallaecimonas xiamenensis]|uniref:Ferric uptake regulation protein n=1 Tax=Gallaecimonas xiamenensis 3-C-1 TaxID=745411 RepID=K2JR78_9GAMM|nr:Fur family transcriptional regulator [Gallaecimonas xiamenensis]EKE77863.1 Zn2+ uptake transcriptional regulator [Gallaecimonas xiamenensis 3-C-1]